QKLSAAIGTKIKYREQLQKLNQNLNNAKQEERSKTELDADAIRKQAEEAAFNKINETFLDESEYSDEFKQKVRNELERNPGKTAQSLIKNSEYLQFHLEKEIAEKRAAEAASNGNGERKGAQDGSEGMPDRFTDPTYMVTPEGQKDFEEWEK